MTVQLDLHNVANYERAVLEEIGKRLVTPARIVADDLRLEGRYPHTRVVAWIRADGRFENGRRFRVHLWTEDGRPPGGRLLDPDRLARVVCGQIETILLGNDQACSTRL